MVATFNQKWYIYQKSGIYHIWLCLIKMVFTHPVGIIFYRGRCIGLVRNWLQKRKGTKEAAAPKAKKNGSGGGDRGAGRKPSAVNVKGALTIQKRRNESRIQETLGRALLGERFAKPLVTGKSARLVCRLIYLMSISAIDYMYIRRACIHGMYSEGMYIK